MRKFPKFAVLYLAALLPVTILALLWAVNGFPADRVNYGFVVVGALVACAATRIRIQLPKTSSHLALSDAMVLFSLLYFGGEFALLMSAAAAVVAALWKLGRSTVAVQLTNVCVSIISIFVTAVGVIVLLGQPETVLVELGNWHFILVVGILALVPFALNTILGTANDSISGERHYWKELKNRGADAILVYFGAALMAGLGVVAMKDTNIFLFFTVAGFFAILQIAFGRYRNDFDTSKKERSKLAEKHIGQLKHYIDELELSQEKYRHAALHDSLTGLPNRNRFIEVIEPLIRKSHYVPQFKFAVIYLDINRFKTINDSLGHAMGDQLIKRMASRLSKLAENGELIGRFSGDEFAILLPDVSCVEQTTAFTDQILEAFSQPFVLDSRQLFTAVSMGIAVGSAKYRNAGDVLRDADIAMYRAKERKRSVVLFEDNMHVQAVSLLQRETDLRLAVERKEFELFYQPIIELDTTRLAGVEALVRWSHPEFGQLNPEQFIEISEATGLIVPMTQQILESACLMLKKWNSQPEMTRPLFVSVNLSGKHFNHPDVVEHIEAILKKTGVDPRNVKLEITETAVMDNAEKASGLLKQIKDLGVQISIDDFGTGYSSLSYLQRFPIDTLKIDRSFVRSMEEGRQNGEIVKSILALADAMKLSVVAEGIESVHQLHQLRILNCRYGQGFLFSHPLPADEIIGLLRTANRWENLVSGSSFSIVPPAPEILEERIH